MRPSLCPCLIATFICSLASAADVSIRLDGASRHITAPGYEAVVADDGALTNLRVAGEEFLALDCSRGAYFYQGGVPKLPDIARSADNAIIAKCDKASIRYDFAADGVTFTLTNATAKQMEWVIVFAREVTAVKGPGGGFVRPPVNCSWRQSTWFRGEARLTLDDATRLWGPFATNHQVYTITIPPNATKQVTCMVGPASAADIAAAEAARPVPPPTDPKGPMWDMKALSAAPKVYPAEGFSPTDDGIRPVFFEGPPFEGQPSRVFAWIGIPKVALGTKVPGMVLVHGGGGTAFDTWVRLWVQRGYAAISMDTCGCIPKGTYGNWEHHAFGGPAGWGGYSQIDQPREDQWTYHAVADAILAHSLLRSLPEVDPDRIGLTGISWGGYLTCIIAGVDHRYRFAAPVYGCGFTLDMAFAGSVTGLGKERADRWMRWWDPSVYLPDAPMPMLWVTGSNDFAYTFNALQKSYRLPKSPHTLAIRLRMPHGHGPAGEGPEEIHAFADSFLKGGDPLATVTGQGREGSNVWATFTSKVPIVKAELNVTHDLGAWQDRRWDALPATVDAAGKITATLPEGVTVYYINLFDNRNLVVSTEHVELAH